MKYKDYLIEEDPTGYAPKNMRYAIYSNDGEVYVDSCENIEECKKLIDEL